MRAKKYQEFGGTTACTLRLVDTSMEYDYYPIDDDDDSDDTEEKKQLFIRDSWFGLVNFF